MFNMLYLLMEDPTANRYMPVNAYKRDPNTGILLPVEGFPRSVWNSGGLTINKARVIPTKVIINGHGVDNVLRHLSGAPSYMDGMTISPYDPLKSVKKGLSPDMEATVADIESMLREMRQHSPIPVVESCPDAEFVRAGYFTFGRDAKTLLSEQEARILRL